jgi:hypothetical protein
VVSFLRSRLIKMFSTSLTSCKKSLRKLHSVVGSTYRRIRSLLSEEASGAAAVLLSLGPRVKKVIANCPVVDWGILDRSEKAETSKKNYAEYIRGAFGNGYRLSDTNWKKLRSGTFYNPWQHRSQIDGSKLMIFHAKDDPNVPYERTREFAELTGATLRSLKSGGPISTDYVSRKYWPLIKKFFDSKP